MKAYKLVSNRIKDLNLSQEFIATKIGRSQPAVNAALQGKSRRALELIIDLLVREYGCDRLEFYPESAPRIEELFDQVRDLRKTVDALVELVKKQNKDI